MAPTTGAPANGTANTTSSLSTSAPSTGAPANTTAITTVTTTGTPNGTVAPGAAPTTALPSTSAPLPPPPTWQPIRIALSFLDLHDSTMYCNESGVVRPDFKGNLVTCAAADIFTPSMAQILEHFVLPEAIRRIRSHMSVIPVVGNLSVPFTSICTPFTVPPSDVLYGVPEADFRLYVGAGPTPLQTLAWAGYCSLDQNGRPVIARSNFNPQHISWNVNDSSLNEPLIRTAIHELHHAFGFTQQFMKSNFPGGQSIIQTVTIRSKTTLAIGTPTVVAKAQEFFNCSNMSFVELEDEGGAGTAGSHWERRNLAEELMAGVAQGNLLSPLTMAYMQDSGHYRVDFNGSETMNWGRNASCDFITNFCNTTAGGLGTLYCFEQDQSVWNCNTDLTGIGPCMTANTTTPIPSYFQYNSANPQLASLIILTDNCPSVLSYSNLVCNELQPDNAPYVQLGHYFGPGGRCFSTKNLVAVGPQKACLQSRCVANSSLQVQTPDGVWNPCPRTGGDISLSVFGAAVTITCPAVERICYFPLPTDVFVPSTPAPSTSVPTTGAPSMQPSSTTGSPVVASTAPSAAGSTSAQVATPTATGGATASVPGSPTSATNSPPGSPVTAVPPTSPPTPMPSGLTTIAQCSVSLNGSSTRFKNVLQLNSGPIQLAIVKDLATLLSLSSANLFLDSYMTSGQSGSGALNVLFHVAVSSTLASQAASFVTLYNTQLRGAIATMSSVSFSSVAAVYNGVNNITGMSDVVPLTGSCLGANGAPTAVVAASGSVVLGGTDFRAATATTQLLGQWKLAVASDIASFLGLAANSINVTSFDATSSSLAVAFDVVLPATVTSASNFTSVLNATLASSALASMPCSQSSALLGSTSGSRVVLQSASVSNPTPAPGLAASPDASWDSHCVVFQMTGCAYIQIGIAAVIVLLLLFCLYMCLCSKKHPDVKKKPGQGERSEDELGVLHPPQPQRPSYAHDEMDNSYRERYQHHVPPAPPLPQPSYRPPPRILRDEDYDDL